MEPLSVSRLLVITSDFHMIIERSCAIFRWVFQLPPATRCLRGTQAQIGCLGVHHSFPPDQEDIALARRDKEKAALERLQGVEFGWTFMCGSRARIMPSAAAAAAAAAAATAAAAALKAAAATTGISYSMKFSVEFVLLLVQLLRLRRKRRAQAIGKLVRAYVSRCGGRMRAFPSDESGDVFVKVTFNLDEKKQPYWLKENFRMARHEQERTRILLGIPDDVLTKIRNRCPGSLAFMMLLYKLSWPRRISDLRYVFGGTNCRSVQAFGVGSLWLQCHLTSRKE
jgi:hypothetical protein